jgi:inosine-uridine nucleoside N-ribohydrolase
MKLPAGLKKRIRRTIIFLLILSLVVILVITFTQYGSDIFSKKNTYELIIDSDTDNKPDAPFAILRLLIAENVKVLAVNAVHSGFRYSSQDSSMWKSQMKNEEILKAFEFKGVSAFPGEIQMLPLKNQEGKFSQAAENIVKLAKRKKSKEKLKIVSFGPLTNIAAAILKDSTVASEICVYCVAMEYDIKGKIWNKNEFNVRSDLDALDILLNTQDLEIYFLPYNITESIMLTSRETDKYLLKRTDYERYLSNFSNGIFEEKERISIPSISLVEIILNPDFVKKEQVLPPPENKKHFVYVYSKVNSEMIKADFWAALLKYFRSKSDEKKDEDG